MFRRIATYAFIAMAALAVWRGAEGDLGTIMDGVISFISAGADVLLELWNSLFD